jgi:hypothetical protein
MIRRARGWVLVVVAQALSLVACVAAPSGPEVPTGYRWEELSLPPDSGLSRWGFMVADRGDGTSVLFGGTTLDAFADGGSFDDTWLVDARGELPAFTRLEASGGPGPRYCGCAAFDRGKGRVVVVGGRNLEMLAPETWILDMRTNAWTLLEVETPPGVLACAMAYAAERDALYLFGGLGGMDGEEEVDGGTYRFDPDVPAWTKLPVSGPSARFSAILTDVAPGEPLLLFGGTPRTFGVHYLADVWRFDTATETWSETEVAGTSPPGRREGWLRAEPDGRGFLVGMGTAGVAPNDVLSDLWRFDFATRTFTDLTPAASPLPRGFSLYIPAAAGQAGLLLGGFDNLRLVPGLHRLLPPEDDPRW